MYEEAVRAGNYGGLLRLQAEPLTILPGSCHITYTQGEMARADRVGLVFQQAVQVLIAEVEPEHLEVERARLVDRRQAEQVAIKAPLRSRSVINTLT